LFVKADLRLSHVAEIDLETLSEKGIRGFLFDLDNTLMIPHTGVLDDTVKNWLDTVHAKGFQCFVVSNNKDAQYVEEAAVVLGFPGVAHAAKPSRRYFQQALDEMNLTPEQVAVVGDRPLTDIWGGQRLGAMTILVEPLNKAHEPTLYHVLRWLERLVLAPNS
jgi:HAD superfamily phosphatase (TIGR01668 family)